MSKARVHEEQLLYGFTPYIEMHYTPVIFGTESKEIKYVARALELIPMEDINMLITTSPRSVQQLCLHGSPVTHN